MNIFYSFLKYALKITLILLILLILSIEIFYRYRINQLQPVKIVSEIEYSEMMTDTLLVSFGETSKKSIEPLSVTEYLFDIVKYMIEYEYAGAKHLPQNGPFLSYFTARHIAFSDNSKKIRGHTDIMFMTVWISNNYTANEALNYLLDSLYYGHQQFGISNAAKFYFNKTVNELNLSEIISLITITQAPSNYDPYCRQESNDRIISKSERLFQLLSDFKYKAYGKLKYKYPKFNIKSKVKCT